MYSIISLNIFLFKIYTLTRIQKKRIEIVILARYSYLPKKMSDNIQGLRDIPKCIIHTLEYVCKAFGKV